MVVLSVISLKSWSLFIQMSFLKSLFIYLSSWIFFLGSLHSGLHWLCLCCAVGSILLAHPISFKLIITVHIEACSDSNLWKVYLRCGGVLPIALYQEPLQFWLSFLLCPWDWSLGGVLSVWSTHMTFPICLLTHVFLASWSLWPRSIFH